MGSGRGQQSQTSTIDPEYNRGMLELSQKADSRSQILFNQFRYGVDYDPNEEVTGYMDESGKFVESKDAPSSTVNAPGGLNSGGYPDPLVGARDERGYLIKKESTGTTQQTPTAQNMITKTRGEVNGYDPKGQTSEMDYLQNIINENQKLLGLQTATEREGLQTERSRLKTVRKAYKFGRDFMDELQEGVSSQEWANEAQAGVQHGFKNMEASRAKDLQSYGLDPSAGRYAGLRRETEQNQALGIAAARTTATRAAEEEDLRRKAAALEIASTGLR